MALKDSISIMVVDDMATSRSLIIMALGIMGGMLFGVGGHAMPEMELANWYPGPPDKQLPIWPLQMAFR